MTASPLLLSMPTPLLVTNRPIQGLKQGPDVTDEHEHTRRLLRSICSTQKYSPAQIAKKFRQKSKK
jgi:hypothetical protein